MSDIPHYFLYGEAVPSNALAYFDIARLEQSLPKHNWEIHPHRHDNLHQLLILEKGKMLAQVRDLSVEREEHCLLSIPPKEVHGFVHQPNVEGYIVTISQPFLMQLFNEKERELFPQLFRESLVVQLEPGSQHSKEAMYLTQQLIKEYHSSDAAQESMIGGYLKILLLLIHRSLKPNQISDVGLDSKIVAYEAFMALVDEHYLEHWSVAQYADELGLSAGRLNRLCQRFADQHALQLIHERLITEAKRQLIYTQLSAKEIGYKLGFEDPGYFSRFFRRVSGLPPKQFQKKAREQRDITE